jgi:hypothetical protein
MNTGLFTLLKKFASAAYRIEFWFEHIVPVESVALSKSKSKASDDEHRMRDPENGTIR